MEESEITIGLSTFRKLNKEIEANKAAIEQLKPDKKAPTKGKSKTSTKKK